MRFNTRFRVFVAACLLLAVAGPVPGQVVDYRQEERLKAALVEAEAGDTAAQYRAGDMYFKGRGAYVDREKALYWFRRAASQGHRKAEFKLGYMYLKGLEVGRDAGLAFELLRSSAGKDYAPAQFFLAQMYALGNGVPHSSVLALEWLTRSVRGGYRPHKAELERIRAVLDRQLEGIPQAAPEAPWSGH